MGLVLQTQRRALERAIGANHQDLSRPRRYYLKQGHHGQIEIFFCGVSRGVGTCADLHDLDIAVFGYENPGDPPPRLPEKAVWFSTLVRQPTHSEKRLASAQTNGNQGLMIVETLKLVKVADHVVLFEQDGRTADYVPLV